MKKLNKINIFIIVIIIFQNLIYADVKEILKRENVLDNLISTDIYLPLSANQGKVLNDNKVDKITGKVLSTNDYTSSDKSKLDNIATGATANQTDGNLLSRSNHTGTQLVNTISDFDTAIYTYDKSEITAGTNAVVVTNDTNKTITISNSIGLNVTTLTAKTSTVDGDYILVGDSESSNIIKKSLFSTLWNYIFSKLNIVVTSTFNFNDEEYQKTGRYICNNAIISNSPDSSLTSGYWILETTKIASGYIKQVAINASTIGDIIFERSIYNNNIGIWICTSDYVDGNERAVGMFNGDIVYAKRFNDQTFTLGNTVLSNIKNLIKVEGEIRRLSDGYWFTLNFVQISSPGHPDNAVSGIYRTFYGGIMKIMLYSRHSEYDGQPCWFNLYYTKI